MKNYYDSVRSERQLKSLTGLGKQEFEKLLQAFSDSLKEISDEEYRRNRKKRSRPGGGRKGQLSNPENKLFLIITDFGVRQAKLGISCGVKVPAG